MNIKRKLNQYVQDMNIPAADRVLPEGVSQTEGGRKPPQRKYKYCIGIAGTAVACAAAATVLIWQPWQNAVVSDQLVGNAATGSENDMLVAEHENNGIDTDVDDKQVDTIIPDEAAPGGSDEPAATDVPVGSASDKTDLYGDGEIVGEKTPGAEGELSEAEAPGYVVEAPDALAPDAVAPDYLDEAVEECDPSWGNGQELSAGTLTGGEIRDLRNWDNWLRALSTEYMEPWNMVLKQRAVVYVHNDAEALCDVHVRLMEDETVLYEAVTDVTGYAYLFYQYTLGSQQSPTAVQVQSADGSWLSYDCSRNAANEQIIDVELEQENKTVKVDLMYVIDTTGSMWDELDYLKAEIQDVIERAGEQTGAEIRTSVNFYRDEGDEYVVKYYDFREDAAEVSALVAEQSADGGGDEPEAVHTALENALHQHSWAEDSTVKLLFLVLDAPPHDDKEVKEEILSLTEEAAAMGVRIIPVAASGAGEDTQQLLRSMAVMTGGTFIFLDDNSGVGYGHTVPVKPEEYSSEYLNEMMIRIIGEYCGVTITAQEIEKPSETETTEFHQ